MTSIEHFVKLYFGIGLPNEEMLHLLAHQQQKDQDFIMQETAPIPKNEHAAFGGNCLFYDYSLVNLQLYSNILNYNVNQHE